MGGASAAGRAVAAELSELSRRDRIEVLRRRIAAVPARGESVVARTAGTGRGTGSGRGDDADTEAGAASGPAGSAGEDVLAVPPPLAGLLPRGGLPRGSVVTVGGASSLLVGLLAAVTASGGHAAVIGHPRLGLLAAAEMGADLARLAVIPDPGPDPAEVAAVLLDGLDLVVLGLGERVVPPSRARAVVARARSKGATLLVTGGGWPGAEIRLDASVREFHGLAGGGDRLRGLRLAVGAEGRAFRRRTALVALCPQRGRVEWVSEPARPQQLSRAVDGVA